MSQLPADLPDLLTLCHAALLYLQDEMQVVFHPTLTHVLFLKDRLGQRLVQSPLDNRKTYGLVNWRVGWLDSRVCFEMHR